MCVCVCVYVRILFWDLSVMYLNASEWSVWLKHVANVDGTNKVCCGRR